MAKTVDILMALEQLERALDTGTSGQQGAWASCSEQKLTQLQQALQRHAAQLNTPNGPLPDVDRPLLPSPGEDRKATALQHELEQFLKEVETLRAQTRDLGPSAGALRQRVRELAAAVRRYEHAEVDLILDTVTTDIGAGD